MVRLKKVQRRLRACAQRSAIVRQEKKNITNQTARRNAIAKMEKLTENNSKSKIDCESNLKRKIHEALIGKLSYYFS